MRIGLEEGALQPNPIYRQWVHPVRPWSEERPWNEACLAVWVDDSKAKVNRRMDARSGYTANRLEGRRDGRELLTRPILDDSSPGASILFPSRLRR